MKIIISPAKTISKDVKAIKIKKEFSSKTLEIIDKVPEVKLSDELYPAIFMYDGLCFRSMNRDEFDESDLEYIKKNLFILSALFGAVLPFDTIFPYRLDFLMKTKMGNLYDFWKDDIANKVLKNENLIVNLASCEFSKTVKKYSKNIKFLDIEFFENTNGKLKKHSTISKKGRGKMLKFMTKEKIENEKDLKKFNYDGYYFVNEMSTDKKFVFLRDV